MNWRSFQYWFRQALKTEGLRCSEDDPYIRYRLDGVDYCPITLVCHIKTGQYHSPTSVNFAARKLKIPAAVRDVIVFAADNALVGTRAKDAAIRQARAYFKRLSTSLDGDLDG